MQNNRKARFLKKVAEAASSTKPRMPRGKPTPDNLTTEGRAKGMSAMRKATRCNGTSRNGNPCGAPAMRGASRCLKHGGRVEVPNHPHNIRRFFDDDCSPIINSGIDGLSDQEFWEQLSSVFQREVLVLLPPNVIARPSKLFLAARVWMEVRERDYPAVRRFMEQFVRASCSLGKWRRCQLNDPKCCRG